jgi:membrane protein YqaA with SNARE-associated domain
LVFALGSILNPLILSIIVAVGSTIGSSVKYLIGLGGKEILKKKYSKELEKVRKAFEKHKFFLWIIIVTLTPIPDDPISIFCGIVKYDFRKYFFAVLIGRLIIYSVFAYAGYYSIDFVARMLGVSP